MPLVTVAEAARQLGLSENATRQRIRRGSLPSELVNGRRMVRVSATADSVTVAADKSADTPSDQLIEQLKSENQHFQDEIDYLRSVIDRELEASRELRLLLARRDERVEALESQLQLTANSTSNGHIDELSESEESEPALRPWWRFWSK